MKKLVIYVSLILISFCLSAQNYWWDGNVYRPNLFNPDSLNLRSYEDKYLLPCCNGSAINLNILDANANLVNQERDIYIYELASNIPFVNQRYNNLISDYAQPYITDTTISIIGISGYTLSGFMNLSDYDVYRFYYEIRDSTLENILAQVDVTNTNLRYSDYKYESLCYTEKFFDTAINVSGKFYVVYHTPDTLETLKYGYSMIYGTTNCQVENYPLVKMSGDWDTMNTDGTPVSLGTWPDTITMLYLFPILASEEDTNSSGLQNVDISAYTHIFPSPANEEFNVNCGYKIKTLSILDEQGKLLAEREVNAYNYQVNLNNYSSGTYFIRVVTNKGQTVKKLIKL